MIDVSSWLAVVVVTAVGVGLSYFGYGVAQTVLRVTGAIAGFAAGLFAGSYLYPVVAGQQHPLVFTLVAAIVGAGLGRAVVPALGDLAFGVAGFVVTSLSVLSVLSQERLVGVVLRAVPSNLGDATPVTVLERVVSAPLFTDPNFEQAGLIAVVFGLVGGAVAMQFYDEFVVVATTAIGASMLGFAMPVVVATLDTDTVTTTQATEFSPLWFGVVFLTGSAVELYRNREKMTVV